MTLAHMSAQDSAALFRLFLLACFVTTVVFIVINVFIMRAASRYVLKRHPLDAAAAGQRILQFSMKSLFVATAVVALCAWLIRRYTLHNYLLLPSLWWSGSIFAATWSLWRFRAAGRAEVALPLLAGGAVGGAIVGALHWGIIRLPLATGALAFPQSGALGAIGGILLGSLYYAVAKISGRQFLDE